MNKLLSEIIFNRGMIWIVLMLQTSNKKLAVIYGIVAVVNFINSAIVSSRD